MQAANTTKTALHAMLIHLSATTITGSFTFPGPLAPTHDPAFHTDVAVRSDPFASAKSHFFDTSSWGAFCDVTLTLKQTRQSDSGAWVKIDDYRCRQAFRHFMSLLNRAVYGAAFRRHGKRLRVFPYLKEARSTPARCVHESVVRPIDGTFTVQLNCPRTAMLSPLKG